MHLLVIIIDSWGGKVLSSQIVFKQNLILDQTAHQSHIRCEFYLPAGTDKLRIEFGYGPFDEGDPSVLTPAFEREGLSIDCLHQGDRFRNLLTLSLNDPNQFRGAHHYFSQDQVIELSSGQASLGFVAGELPEGNWQVIISCHGIFSKQVEANLQVEAIGNLEKTLKGVKAVVKDCCKPVLKERALIAGTCQFVKTELHAHTQHSDADFTAQELIEAGQAQGLDYLAVTDHNTITALAEIDDQRLLEVDNLQVIPGLEFTTFYGHFLLHGPIQALFHNWTDANLANINDFLKDLRSLPVNITVAHPYDQGNPWCTGCHWDYQISDWNLVDNIEIWNYLNPHDSLSSRLAYEHWVELLSQGYEIGATAGHDWHRPAPEDAKVSFSYLLVPEKATLNQVLESHRLGRSYATIGPLIHQFMVNDTYQIGDRIPDGQDLVVDIGLSHLQEGDQIRLKAAKETLEEWTCQADSFNKQVSLDLVDQTLLRLEVCDQKGRLITFSNPIYRL